MSRPKTARNLQVRARRERGWSLTRLSRTYGVGRSTIRRILESTGGDPLAVELADLAAAPVSSLERERDRLQDRIRTDRRRLRMVLEELDSRRTDEILGLEGCAG